MKRCVVERAHAQLLLFSGAFCAVFCSSIALISPVVRTFLSKLHSKSSLLFSFQGNRMKKVHGRGGSGTESFTSEGSMQQKKRLASEETPEDFEGEEQDQGKRSCLSFSDHSSQVIFGSGQNHSISKNENIVGTVTLKVGSATQLCVLLVTCCLPVALRYQSAERLGSRDCGSLQRLGFLSVFLGSGTSPLSVPQEYLTCSFTAGGWKTWAEVVVLGAASVCGFFFRECFGEM